MSSWHKEFIWIFPSFALLWSCATFDQGNIDMEPDGSLDDSESINAVLDSDNRGDTDPLFSTDTELHAGTDLGDTADTACIDSNTEPPANDYPHDPGATGPYGIKEQKTTIDKEDATFYLPIESGAVAKGPFPLVLVHAGFQVGHEMYSHFSERIASHGFVVVGIEMPGADDNHENNARHTIAVIDWLLSSSNPHVDIIDPGEIATAGHSLGGKIAIFAAALDSRITNVIAWDPVDTGGPPCQIDPVGCKRWSVTPEMMDKVKAKLLIMGGMVGTGLFTCTPKGEAHPNYFEEANGVALHLTFPHSDHLDWMRDGGDSLIGLLGKLLCGSLGSTSTEDVHRIANQTQVAWLLKYAKGHTNLDDYLGGSKLDPDVQQGIVVVEHHP